MVFLPLPQIPYTSLHYSSRRFGLIKQTFTFMCIVKTLGPFQLCCISYTSDSTQLHISSLLDNRINLATVWSPVWGLVHALHPLPAKFTFISHLVKASWQWIYIPRTFMFPDICPLMRQGEIKQERSIVNVYALY